MQVFRELAGYSLGRADVVRRAMSKKKHDVMAREREIFLHGLTDETGAVVVEGCDRRGVPEKIADVIFNDMSAFASYAFNKPHAARLRDGGLPNGLSKMLLSPGIHGRPADQRPGQRQGGPATSGNASGWASRCSPPRSTGAPPASPSRGTISASACWR